MKNYRSPSMIIHRSTSSKVFPCGYQFGKPIYWQTEKNKVFKDLQKQSLSAYLI